MVDTQDLKQIEQELKTAFFKQIEQRATLVKAIEEPNLIVYNLFEGDNMTLIGEVPLARGMMPEEFKYFIQNWPVAAKQINSMIDSVEELEPVQGYNVTKTTANAPWPLSKRVIFAARYPCIHHEPDHHVLLIAEKGSETRAKFTEKDAAEFALARCHIAGWSFKPVYEGETLVGTRIIYVTCADAGGNVPTSVQNMVGPKQCKSIVGSLVALITKRQQDSQTDEYLKSITDYAATVSELKKKWDYKVEQLFSQGKVTDDQKELAYALYQ